MAISRKATADFSLQNEGTIFLLRPHSQAAKEWIEEHISVEECQRFGNAIAVEHSYICSIIDGIRADGLEVCSQIPDIARASNWWTPEERFERRLNAEDRAFLAGCCIKASE